MQNARQQKAPRMNEERSTRDYSEFMPRFAQTQGKSLGHNLRVVFGVLALFISLFLFTIQNAEAAVSHSASSESHTGTTGSQSEASFSWTHDESGQPEGVLVFVTTGFNADYISTVTYGGQTMTQISEAAYTGSEPGRMTAFFLGSGIPSGNQTVVVNRANNVNPMYASAVTVQAGADTRAVGAVTLEGFGIPSEQSIDDGSPGVDSVRYAAIHSGASLRPDAGANSTELEYINFTARSSSLVRETTAGQGARSVGFTDGASDEVMAVHVAIREETEQIFHLADSESHSNSSSTNEIAFNWYHGATGDEPEGVLVFVTTLADDDYITSVSYGSVPMVQVGEAVDTTGEPGRLTTFFLGKNVPTGNRQIVVVRTNNATPMYASAASIDYMLHDGEVLEATDVTTQSNDGSLAEQNIDDGSQSSIPTLRYAGVYSGLDAAPGVGTNSKLLQDNDFGVQTASMVVEKSAGTSSRPVGWSASSDDRAAVYLAVRPQQPSVTHVRSSESSVSASTDFFQWTHSSSLDDPEGVLVFVETLSGIADYITSVTFGGVPMTEIGQARDSSGESVYMTAFFLGAGVPAGSQAVRVDRTNNTASMKGYAISVDTPDGTDTEVFDVTLLENDGTLSEQSIDDGLTSGVQSLRYAALHSGLSDVPSPGTNSYELDNHDYGLEVSSLISEINPGFGARSLGWSDSFTDDRAGVFVAVRATTTTSYSGAGSYTYTVPEGVYSIEIKAWGAGGGGGGGGTNGAGGAGGGGGFASGTIPVTPGQQIGVVVGEGGSQGLFSSGLSAASSGDGAGGGGRSMATTSSGTLIVAAGGGGGGGGDNSSVTAGGAGGAGGGTTGSSGGASVNAPGGGGGTASAGGAGGNGTGADGETGSSLSGGDGGHPNGAASCGGDTLGGIAGGAPNGGNGAEGDDGGSGCAGGGGGGDGYYGGGGGSGSITNDAGGGGGGGGSSYATTSATGAALVSGSGTNAANDTDPDYFGSFGDGGSGGATSGNGAIGNDGFVVITALEELPTITLSGTVYTDEGVTADTTSRTIKVAVGTSTPSVHTTTSNGSGVWTLDVDNSNLFVSMPIVAWVDGDSVKASHFTKASSTSNNIPNLDLYQNRVIISHEGTSGTSTTNSDLSFYDGDDDADIQYMSNDINDEQIFLLSVRAGNELHIKTGKTYEPGGAVTINGNAGSGVDGSFHLPLLAKYTAGGTTTIAGNLTASSTASFTPGSYNLVFNATTTGKSIDTILTSEGGIATLGDVTFNGSGGAWSFTQANATTSDLTITAGTLTAPSGILTIEGDYSNSGTFTHNSGLVRAYGQGWDNLQSATYDSNPFSVSSQTGYPGGIFFKPDGTKMYIGSITTGNIYQYTLSTPWVVTSGSASYDGTFSASAYGTAAMETHFSPDGTKMFVLMGGSAKGHVITFTLSTPWVITSGVSFTESYNITTQQSSPYGFTFKPDGTKLYVVGSSGDDIDSYTLSTPWVVSTSSIAVEGTPFAITPIDTSPSALAFSPDGTKLYVLGFGTNSVRSYSLSTPWEVSGSSATHDGVLFSANDSFGYGLYIKPDARKAFTTGTNLDSVFTNDVEGEMTMAGTMTGTSALNDVEAESSVTFSNNASTTDLTINSGATVVAPANLTIAGNYTQNGSFTDSSGTVHFNGSTAQAIAGTMTTSATDFNGVIFSGAGNKTFSNNASTTDFTINSGATVVAPANLTISGDYTNLGNFTDSSGTVNFNGTTQSIGGFMTGTSDDFNNVIMGGSGTKSVENEVEIQDLTINSGVTFIPYAAMTIDGDYSNSGTFTHNNSTTTLGGTVSQSLSGNLSGTSAFRNLAITNKGTGDSVAFNAALEVTGHFVNLGADSSILLEPNATSTFNTMNIQGTTGNEITLNSNTVPATHTIDVNGTYTFDYLDVSYSNACPNGTLYAGANSISSLGNTTCWSFTDVPIPGTMTSAQDHHFYVGQATTTLDTVTLSVVGTIANDIRIHIDTATTSMKFDTGATPSFGGEASGKVGSVTYENNNATMVIAVTSDFSGLETLTVSGIEVGNFSAVSSAAGNFTLHTDGNVTGEPNATDSKTINITGSLTVSEHSAGQVDNIFSFQNKTDEPLFGFNLASAGEDGNIGDIVITLSGITDLTTADLTNLRLHRDTDNDGVLDGGDVLIDGSGILTMNGQWGAITFNTDWTATSSQSANYLVTGNTVSIPNGASVVFKLLTSGITSTGETSNYGSYVISTVSSIQHSRNNAGGGGSASSVGGAPPPGDGVETGGDETGGGELGETDGDNIADDPDFKKPSSTGASHNQWTNPTNAYNSDGSAATASTNGFQQSYSGFGLSIPGSNTIQGISVKVDASGSTAAGTLDIALGWNCDTSCSWTTAKATPTLSGSDIVYSVGGPSDTWGKSGGWSPSDFSGTNFRIRITANTSSNTLNLDALQVRVYHQAGGGGSGGGGGVI